MPKPADWYAPFELIAFDGLELRAGVMGEGSPLLVLHGFPTSSFDFSRVAPDLVNGCRLICFDYPGYGMSDKPLSYPYSLFKYADAAEATAVHFGYSRLSIFAHDIGDSVALELLRRSRLEVDQLILMNGSVWSIPFDNFKMRLLQRLMLHPTLGTLMGQGGLISKRFIAATFKPIFAKRLSAAEIDAFWSLIHRQHGNRLYPILMRYMLERWEYQSKWLDALASHRSPLTLIWGQADPIATPAVADKVIQFRPDALDIRLEGVGHYPHWEAPNQVVEVVRSVLA